MDEIILNKKCFIKEQSSNRVYSSVTGELLCNDGYNLEKHANKMFFQETDFREKPLKEKEDFVFAFKGYSDRMIFMVYTPVLIRAHGIRKYLKGEWMKVYQCVFYKDGRLEEEGLQSIDYWKTYSEMKLLNKESFYQIMYNNFHIPGIANLRMFVDIFRGKGFHYEEMLPPEVAKMEISKLKTHKPEWYMPSFTSSFLHMIRDEGKVYGKVLKNSENQPILALEVVDNFKKTSVKALIGENYFYTEDVWNLKRYLDLRLDCEISEEDIELFDAAYPSFGLKQFLEAEGGNILQPLFCANYDRILELLVKAQCIEFSALYCGPYTDIMSGINWEGKNLKEIFGLPVAVLRKINRFCAAEENLLEDVQKIYAKVPNLIRNIDEISINQFEFLKINLLGGRPLGRMRIRGFENMNEALQTKIVKYMFEECAPFAFRIYLDYLHMCQRINPRRPICGYTPKNLQAAHDEAQKIFGEKDRNTKLQQVSFKETVEQEEYYKRASDYGEEAKELEDEKFEIQCPKEMEDLQREGKSLHHCVAAYVGHVILGDSQIYFLREKENPDTPYATIEVCDGRVKQLKGPCNQRVGREGQDFVRKWADLKGLKIDTYDMVEERCYDLF